NRREDAIDALSKSIELYPEFNSAHYELGQIYLADNQLDEALKEFKICESIESVEDPELAKLIKEIELKLQNNISE
ncbi:MAG: tetratricopeptide repeat protein, partial [Candidatus Lokiarchaeota archaeon]|nr:tetratricopeptide repeat protein [Candidatus Lokiarchaeota archaeon]